MPLPIDNLYLLYLAAQQLEEQEQIAFETLRMQKELAETRNNLARLLLCTKS